MSSPVRLNLIAAACNNMGIGVNGGLPWTIKADMKYFNVMSTGSPPEGKRNVAIMGRKTWFSIPPKFRPLKNRINVVLSKTLKDTPEGAHHLCDSLESAVSHLSQPIVQNTVHEVWIIGGEAIYKAAMDSSHPCRIYMTKVFTDVECDTFFPSLDSNKYHTISVPGVNGEIQEENGLKFQYLVYEETVE